MRKGMHVLAMLVLLFLIQGCGENLVDLIVLEETDSESDSESETESEVDSETEQLPPAIMVEVIVPMDFDATPVRIEAAFHLGEGGTPVAIGPSYSDDHLDIGPGNSYQYISTQMGLEGSYYLGVVLFVEGGGVDIPQMGVDYKGLSPNPIILGEGTGMVNAGVVPLNDFWPSGI